MIRAPKVIALFAAMVALSGPTLTAAPPAQRSFAAGSFGLELEGTFVGFATKIEGGNAVADVVKEPVGADFFVKKHLGNPGVRDIVLEFGGGMHASLYNWIKASLERKHSPKDGAVLMVDFKGAVRRRLDFQQAQITQVTLPGVDGSSKEAIRFSIRLTTASTNLNRNAGGTVSFTASKAQKTALASTFRLSIDGLDMSRASKVEALTINLPLQNDPSGECFRCEVTPAGPIDFPNVFVTLAESHAESAYDWLEDFVINGDNSDESEKQGTLEYLSANLATTLFQISFKQLGVFEIAPAPSSDTDAVAKVTLAMYCERIEFSQIGQAN